MEAQLVKNDDCAELKLSGELTINSINEIKDKMIETLCLDSAIKLNHQQVTEVDISYMQLLKSFCYTAEKKELELTIVDNNTDILKKLLDTSGIREFVLSENAEDKNE